MNKNQYVNREISWLRFNERVLQESVDVQVPLIERLRFLGIFSNNLDEFFKVRYATVKRIVQAGKSGKSVLGGERAKDLLDEITNIVIRQQKDSQVILKQIEEELEKENIFLIDETEIQAHQEEFLKTYFSQNVGPSLMTIILNSVIEFPTLKDTAAYLAVKMVLEGDNGASAHEGPNQYALIEIPKEIDRFIVLPRDGNRNYIMLLDDLIRYSLNSIFNMFSYTSISAHMIKITRDAELDIDNDLSKSFIEKISSSVENRKISDPVRFVYDSSIEADTLNFLKEKMNIEDTDSVIPGGRYHNRRDYMGFPSLGRSDLMYERIKPLPVEGLTLDGSLFERIAGIRVKNQHKMMNIFFSKP